MVGKRFSTELSFDDSLSYIASVRKALENEPGKYGEFIKLLEDYRAQRLDVASLIARVENLMKDYPKLLRGFNAFLPAETKKAIAPEATSTTRPVTKITIRPVAEQGSAHGDHKRKRVDADGASFMEKLETRFRTLDTHKVESFRKIMIAYREGKKSEKEVRELVYDLLYYHEDLIEDFFRFLSNKSTR